MPVDTKIGVKRLHSDDEMSAGIRPSIANAVVEAALWGALSLGFLAVYAEAQPTGEGAFIAHLSLFGTFLLLLGCVRLCVWSAIRSERFASWLNALVVATGLLVVAAYYSAVLLGLHSWGRVISWSLIETYAAQWQDLLGVLGIPVTASVTAAAIVLLAVVAMLAGRPARWDWTRAVASSLSPHALSVCIVAGLGVVSVQAYAFIANPKASIGEPVSLTFFPEQAGRPTQSHSWKGTPAREAAEDRARADYLPAATASRRNVILIIGDALRPDHMSLFGYGRDTTPHLSRAAETSGGARTGRMLAACAESSCGLMAIARSKYVHEFTDRDISLPEVLRKHGYGIHLILSGDHTNFYGLRDAYGSVDSYYDGASAKGRYMNDDQLVLDRVAALPVWNGEPVMLQFHLMSAHGLGTRASDETRYQPASNYYRVRTSGSPGSASEAVNFYDNGVSQLDRVVDRILGGLKDRGYLDDALVVLTADHGELLGEHGEFTHARTVYQEVLRVPFVMLSFGHRSDWSLDDGSVYSQVDIAPTILEELRMPIPSTWSGRPLQRPPARDFVRFQQGAQVGLVDLRASGQTWKYWLDLEKGDEVAVDIANGSNETENQIGNVAPHLRQGWRRQVMDAGAAVVIRD